LEERRTGIRAELSQLLINGKNAGCSCGWGKNCSDTYTLLLSEYGPLKMLEVPLSDIIKKMEKVSYEDMERAWHAEIPRGYYHEARDFPGKLKTIKKKVGICLDCVRSSDAATPCRFQHE
jgi:hypothetical protein